MNPDRDEVLDNYVENDFPGERVGGIEPGDMENGGANEFCAVDIPGRSFDDRNEQSVESFGRVSGGPARVSVSSQQNVRVGDLPEAYVDEIDPEAMDDFDGNQGGVDPFVVGDGGGAV
eukprot:516530_1